MAIVFCRETGWQGRVQLADIGLGFAQQTDYAVAFVERGLGLMRDGGVLGVVVTSKIQ